MIHRGHANDGRSLRWTSWRRRGDVATSSTWHNFPQPLSVLWNGKLPLYCYSWFNFVGFCFFDSKLELKDKAKSCQACFFLHVSSSQGQFYICRMQGSSGLHESDTNQDKVQGIFSTRKSQVWMAFCHTFISQQKKVHTDWCLPHSTFVNSVEPMEATWSYHHFESGGPMPCVPSKTFLELSLWYTRSCTHRLECLVCATVSKVVVLCGETWACPTGGWKGPHQIQQVVPILKSTDFYRP